LAVAHTFPPIKVLRYIAAMCYISLYIYPTVARWHKIIAYENEVNMVTNLIEVENSGKIKGTVSRDFLPSVFFIKQYPLGP
jgi:hypothetical protein